MVNLPQPGDVAKGFVVRCQPISLANYPQFFVGSIMLDYEYYNISPPAEGDPAYLAWQCVQLEFDFWSLTAFAIYEPVIFEVVQESFALAAENVQSVASLDAIATVTIGHLRENRYTDHADRLQAMADAIYQI